MSILEDTGHPGPSPPGCSPPPTAKPCQLSQTPSAHRAVPSEAPVSRKEACRHPQGCSPGLSTPKPISCSRRLLSETTGLTGAFSRTISVQGRVLPCPPHLLPSFRLVPTSCGFCLSCTFSLYGPSPGAGWGHVSPSICPSADPGREPSLSTIHSSPVGQEPSCPCFQMTELTLGRKSHSETVEGVGLDHGCDLLFPGVPCQV